MSQSAMKCKASLGTGCTVFRLITRNLILVEYYLIRTFWRTTSS